MPATCCQGRGSRVRPAGLASPASWLHCLPALPAPPTQEDQVELVEWVGMVRNGRYSTPPSAAERRTAPRDPGLPAWSSLALAWH